MNSLDHLVGTNITPQELRDTWAGQISSLTDEVQRARYRAFVEHSCWDEPEIDVFVDGNHLFISAVLDLQKCLGHLRTCKNGIAKVMQERFGSALLRLEIDDGYLIATYAANLMLHFGVGLADDIARRKFGRDCLILHGSRLSPDKPGFEPREFGAVFGRCGGRPTNFVMPLLRFHLFDARTPKLQELLQEASSRSVEWHTLDRLERGMLPGMPRDMRDISFSAKNEYVDAFEQMSDWGSTVLIKTFSVKGYLQEKGVDCALTVQATRVGCAAASRCFALLSSDSDYEPLLKYLLSTKIPTYLLFMGSQQRSATEALRKVVGDDYVLSKHELLKQAWKNWELPEERIAMVSYRELLRKLLVGADQKLGPLLGNVLAKASSGDNDQPDPYSV